MSTLELEHIKHSSSSSNNLSVHSDGSLTLGNLTNLNVNGNLGIGTTTGSESLNTTGNLRFQTTNTVRIEYLNTTGAYALGTTGGAAIGFNRPATGDDEIFFETHNGGVSHAERMRINKDGFVTTPNQPAWFYIGGTSLTYNSYVVTKPSSAVISSSHYNTTTGLFTAPISGKYLVGVEGLIYPHSGNVMTNRWQKNGAQYGHVIQSGGENSSHTHLSWTQLVDLAQNDTIGFAINRGGTAENAYSGQWHQWGYLLG